MTGRQIIALWPTAAALAQDLRLAEGTVRQWKNRSGSIPPRYWRAIQGAAERRGYDLALGDFIP